MKHLYVENANMLPSSEKLVNIGFLRVSNSYMNEMLKMCFRESVWCVDCRNDCKIGGRCCLCKFRIVASTEGDHTSG